MRTAQVRCIERDFPGAYMGVSRLLKRQTVYGPTAWMGSLVQDAQDASGLMYRRNRYYDPQTGKFTQEDPIALAGGINAYGFASGDPVSYSDPYGHRGDTIPSISENLVKLRARVKEYLILQGKKQLERKNDVIVWNGKTGVTYFNRKKHSADDYGWVALTPPDGVSVEQFDAAVIKSFNEQARAHEGKPYDWGGMSNSNHFIWLTITGAGAKIPASVQTIPKFAPGICGGAPEDKTIAGRTCSGNHDEFNHSRRSSHHTRGEQSLGAPQRPCATQNLLAVFGPMWRRHIRSTL